MVRGLVTAAAVLLLAATSADAGLFSRGSNCGCAAPVVTSCGGCGGCDNGCGRRVKVRKVKHRGCYAPASCGAPVAAGCCAPAAPVCAPAPAPTCCAPAPTCCAPAAAACNSCAPVATCAGGGYAPAGVAAPVGVAPAPPADNGALADPPKPQAVDTPAPPAK